MASKVQGLDRLNRKLKRLPDAARAEIAKAMEKSAAEVVAMAKSLVPVDSGELRDSIGWSWGEAPAGSMTIGAIKTKGKGAGNLQIVIYAGSDRAYWARWVEFGTSGHVQGGMFAGSTHPGTRAQPFFYPSWRANRRRVRGRTTRAITKSAKMVAAGG